MDFKTKDLKKDNDLLTLKYGVLPDPDFDPKRNNEIIERTMRKAAAKRQEKQQAYHEAIRERSEALASYFQHVNNNRSNNVEAYFGRQLLAKLRGEEILTQLKGSVNIFKKNGKT